LFLTLQKELFKNQNIVVGIDGKKGSVDASDVYFTASDILTNKGVMSGFAAFADYNIRSGNQKLMFNAGFRYDLANFNNGSFTITDPSSFSEFMVNYPTNFNDEKWHAFSFKTAVKFQPVSFFNWYISYGKGFRPPTLDDMCKNGNITKGFKLANPQLLPEKLDNIEMGYTYFILPGLKVEQSYYFSKGKDFQYFVSRGDSVYTGGDNLKPVLQRKNIGEVQILGTEFGLRWYIGNNIDFLLNYAYSHSIISNFKIDTLVGKDLSGKYLMEVAPHIIYSSVLWRTKVVNTLFAFQFRDKQWSDDENLTFTPSRYSFDIKFSKIFNEKWNIALSVQDIFNNRFVDTKGQLSPGRFIIANLTYKFIKN